MMNTYFIAIAAERLCFHHHHHHHHHDHHHHHHHHHLSFIRSSVEDRVDPLVHLVPRGAETSAKGLVQQPS